MAEFLAVPQDLIDLHVERSAAAEDIAAYQLPELPDSNIAEIYDRIETAERRIASPGLHEDDYLLGTAQNADEIFILEGTERALLTAEHATDHFRLNPETNQRVQKIADWGTAGLGYVVAKDTVTNFMTLTGRQSADANNDREHSFKDKMAELMVARDLQIVSGLHGIAPGKVAELTDPKAFDVLIGIGNDPNEASVVLAEKIQRVAQDYDLRSGINQSFIKTGQTQLRPSLKPDGEIARLRFSGSAVGTTRSFAANTAALHGLTVATVQLELSSLLRLMPDDVIRDEKSRQIGVYLGYVLVRELARG